ncbi:hypothetical protein GALMADRAFT_148865 [Galerina marginata CBS 339.88]|uniref:SET domain-containing protein n=1 Tax=Galerina marginata (strain CBS 339.88) TaxID=685588 RepID=A0A067S5S0_GALM3|nr:hypothetical protein GALMADRAFT_148865 [Galerina marginata CBS 339.88]
MADFAVTYTSHRAMAWNQGDSNKSSLVNHLSLAILSSKAILHIDPLIVNALFAQQKEKSESRTHNIKTISLEMNMKPFAHAIIWSMFEKIKHQLNIQDPPAYVSTAETLAKSILSLYPLFVWENKKSESLATLSWCVAAYTLVINPEAIVHLKVKPLGHANQKGFAIHATKDIIKGEYIQELLGLMPEDRAKNYTDLSTITPHSDNRNNDKNSSFDEKILIGPIRFINHRCFSYNVEFVAIRDTYAFTIVATKDIKASEEILLCYGVNYFKEDGSKCLCEDCREIPEEEEEVSKNRTGHINVEEQTKANKNKRAKQKERRKLGPI